MVRPPTNQLWDMDTFGMISLGSYRKRFRFMACTVVRRLYGIAENLLILLYSKYLE